MPIALLVAGAVLLGLALFAPRASEISASKQAIALTLSDDDPFSKFAAAFTKITNPPGGDAGGPQPEVEDGKEQVALAFRQRGNDEFVLAEIEDESGFGEHLAVAGTPYGQIRMTRRGSGGFRPPRTHVSDAAIDKAIEGLSSIAAAEVERQTRRPRWRFGRK